MENKKQIAYPFADAEVGRSEVVKMINQIIKRHYSAKAEG